MLFLPLRKTKSILILGCGFFILHMTFLSSKSYSVKTGNAEISNATLDQYQSCLNALDLDDMTDYVNNTQVKYLYFLPEQTMLLIYLGYFLIIRKLILSAKLDLHDTTNEK